MADTAAPTLASCWSCSSLLLPQDLLTGPLRKRNIPLLLPLGVTISNSTNAFLKRGRGPCRAACSTAPWIRQSGQSPDLHPHKLRHTFASIAITNGADIASVSEALGHSDKAVTLRMYTHAAQESICQAAQIVRDAIEKAGQGAIPAQPALFCRCRFLLRRAFRHNHGFCKKATAIK